MKILHFNPQMRNTRANGPSKIIPTYVVRYLLV